MKKVCHNDTSNIKDQQVKHKCAAKERSLFSQRRRPTVASTPSEGVLLVTNVCRDRPTVRINPFVNLQHLAEAE